MKVLICGVDGYLGWSLALHLAECGHHVVGVDNFARRRWVKEVGSDSAMPIASMMERLEAFGERFGNKFAFWEADLTEYPIVRTILQEFKPEAIVHFAEMPSAPYSMIDADHAVYTHTNNLTGTLNLLFAMRDICPEAQLVKLGTAGEWGTPNVDIPEGFFEIEYRGRKDTLPFPKQPGSLYHCTKCHDSVNIHLACKIWGLRSTDIMQGVVYGTQIDVMRGDPRLRTRFDFDQCFTPETLVVCQDGVRPISEVAVGDRVLTHRGRFRRVAKTFSRPGGRTLLRIRTQDKNNSITCTANHPFLVVERTGSIYQQPRWMSAIEIQAWFRRFDQHNALLIQQHAAVLDIRAKRGWSGRRIAEALDLPEKTVQSWLRYKAAKPRLRVGKRSYLYLVQQTLDTVKDREVLDCSKYNKWVASKYNPDREVRRPLPEQLVVDYDLLRLFGIYLAGGSIGGKSGQAYHIQLSLISERKAAERAFVWEYCNRLGLVAFESPARPGVVHIGSAALARLLKTELGTGAYDKRIPVWVMLLPPLKQRGLLDGLYACDGHKGNHLEIVNQAVCEAVRLLHGRQGRIASIYYRKRDDVALPEGRDYTGNGKFYNCYWWVPSSRGRYRRVAGRNLVPIRGVDPAENNGFVHNLHVAEDNSYVANTVVVHNCFGTAINRFCAQAVLGEPLTLYGKGHQRRGFLPLRDSMQCITLILENPPEKGEYRVFNQFEEVYDLTELAEKVKEVAGREFAMPVRIRNYENPRVEAEEHYYNPDHAGLLKLGYKPTRDMYSELRIVLADLRRQRERLEGLRGVLLPDVRWCGVRKRVQFL